MVTATLLAIHQGLVTLTLDAVPVEKLVQRLSAASGMVLRVDSDVAREIVAVRLTNLGIHAAMARVAEGLNARWVDESGNLTLRRPLLIKEAERPAFVRPALSLSKILLVRLGRDLGLRYDLTAPDRIGDRTRLYPLPAFRSGRTATAP